MKISASLRSWLIAGAVACAAAAATVCLAFQDSIYRWSIRPAATYDRTPPPPRPNYTERASWASMPERPPPGAWESPWGVDVFFIHPTTFHSSAHWNSPTPGDAEQRRLLETLLLNQVGPFETVGPVYAPRYRQASLYAMITDSVDSAGALELAYSDVLRAFDHYILNENRGRGVIVAGVEQGGVHALRLLAERFQDVPLQERLAAAYIIGAVVPSDISGLSQPACTQPGQIHCIVSWNAIIAGEDGERRWRLTDAPYWTQDGRLARLKGQEPLCVNPLLWTTGDALAPKLDHLGGAHVTKVTAASPRIIPAAVSTRCRDGLLEVERPSNPELRQGGGWGARYRPANHNLFFADIASNATGRALEASVWMDANARRPARPLPPVVSLPDAPIHRQDGIVHPVE